MKNFLLLLFIIPFFLSCAHAHQKYYFGSQPAGEEYGTKEHPFTSLQKLSQLNLQPGDTVFFKSGDMLPGTIEADSVIIQHCISYRKSIPLNGKEVPVLKVIGAD